MGSVHFPQFLSFWFMPSSQVTSISMEGVLVGEDLNGCAFVYGSLSFVDKVSCGIALYILESYQGNVCYLVVVVNLITLVVQSEF
jgi:hypothetical protein